MRQLDKMNEVKVAVSLAETASAMTKSRGLTHLSSMTQSNLVAACIQECWVQHDDAV